MLRLRDASRPRSRTRAAAAGLAAVLLLSGACSPNKEEQLEEQSEEEASLPGLVPQEPQPAESEPITEPLPGPSQDVEG